MTAVSAPWADLGNTEGEQKLKYEGTLTPFYDNSSTGARKYVRATEGFTVEAAFPHLTLQAKAYVASMAASVVTTATATGPVTVKRIPNRRGFNPTKYSLLAR